MNKEIINFQLPNFIESFISKKDEA